MPSTRRRPRRTKTQWAEIFERFQASGLGPRAFCRREGLALSSFQRWRARVPAPLPRPQFVELVPSLARAINSTGWTLELSLPNGVCVRLRG